MTTMTLPMVNHAAAAVDRIEARLGGMLDSNLHNDLMNAAQILREVQILVRGHHEAMALTLPPTLGGQSMALADARKLADTYTERLVQFLDLPKLEG